MLPQSLITSSRPVSHFNAQSSQNYFLISGEDGLSWRRYQIMVHDQNQEIKYVSNFSWRQKTSLPVVRTRSFEIAEGSVYPKIGLVEIQHLPKQCSQLTNIQLGEAIYLIKEIILGFQTLSYKFGRISFENTICGINDKGQCRVWPNRSLIETPQNQSTRSDPVNILMQVLDLMAAIIKSEQKQALEPLKIFAQELPASNKTYSCIHEKLNQFGSEGKKNVITMLRRERCMKYSQNQYPRRFSNLKDNPMKIKSNTKINSPAKLKSSSPIRFGKSSLKLKIHNSSKPKVNWNYLNSNKPASVQKKSKELQENKICLWKSVPRSLASLFSNFGKICEETEREAHRLQVQVKEFQIVDEEDQNGQCSAKMSLSNDTVKNEGKSSLSTTQMSESQENKDLNLDRLPVERQSTSIMISPLNTNQQTEISRTYDFGGLLSFPNLEMLGSKEPKQVVKQPFVQNCQEKCVQSILLEKSGIRDSLEKFEGFWDNKTMNLFDNSRMDLKESVYCGGEEYRSPYLDVKLEKLDKFGKGICQSIIPDGFSH